MMQGGYDGHFGVTVGGLTKDQKKAKKAAKKAQKQERKRAKKAAQQTRKAAKQSERETRKAGKKDPSIPGGKAAKKLAKATAKANEKARKDAAKVSKETAKQQAKDAELADRRAHELQLAAAKNPVELIPTGYNEASGLSDFEMPEWFPVAALAAGGYLLMRKK